MVVQHNLSAMNANRNLGVTTGSLSKSTEKLSSGYKINRAGDDAAGLAISEKMRGQIRGLNQASTNAEDGNSLIQTAEGALQETQNILQRMRELAVQATNDTNTDSDREQIQNEINQLTNEVDRIATSSEFNTKKLLNGTQAGAKSYKAGSGTIDGTFSNGNVKLISLKDSASCLVGKEDVIRLTVLKDISAGTADTNVSPGKASAADTKFTIATLNGISGSVTIDFSKGEIKIANAAYDKKTVASNATADKEVVFKISGATSLKAGDVITITLSEMTKTQKAKQDEEGLRFQVGANSGQEVQLNINSMKAKDLGIVKTSTSADVKASQARSGDALSVTTQESASLAIQAYDKALTKVSTERAKLGAVQNRLEHTIANLDTSEENLQAAESRIRDTDMAEEMTAYSKSNILIQAGQSMLAQANQSSQGVLSLLQ